MAPTDTMTPGVASSFSLMGSAIHGGGSCQASITYDNPPTPNSVFKVVQSYEGGCPFSADGNLPANPDNALPAIPVTLPDGLAAGEAVFVWTWFNRIGNREMYMNCAPITIGGSETSTSVFDGLPDMFVANIGVPQSACTTKETFDIQFPNPGNNVITVDSGKFTPACEGSGSARPSSATPPAVTTQPALVGGGSTPTESVGTVFTPINGPSSSAAAAPPPMTTMMTTMMTVTTSAPVATSAAAAPVPTAPAASPSAGAGGATQVGGMVMGACDSSKQSIICHDDPSVYSQ